MARMRRKGPWCPPFLTQLHSLQSCPAAATLRYFPCPCISAIYCSADETRFLFRSPKRRNMFIWCDPSNLQRFGQYKANSTIVAIFVSEEEDEVKEVWPPSGDSVKRHRGPPSRFGCLKRTATHAYSYSYQCKSRSATLRKSDKRALPFLRLLVLVCLLEPHALMLCSHAGAMYVGSGTTDLEFYFEAIRGADDCHRPLALRQFNYCVLVRPMR